MRLEVYRVSNARQLPDRMFWALDGVDTRFLAAFNNYADGIKIVVGAWGTTGEADGQPIGALIVTEDRIVTGYIDLLGEYEYGDADDLDDEELEGAEWVEVDPSEIGHDEPSAQRVLTAMLARYRRATKATWLLVHDADEPESWLEQGFVLVDPPSDIPADDALLVLAWGRLPADAYTLLQMRGLSWHLLKHRGFMKEEG